MSSTNARARSFEVSIPSDRLYELFLVSSEVSVARTLKEEAKKKEKRGRIVFTPKRGEGETEANTGADIIYFEDKEKRRYIQVKCSSRGDVIPIGKEFKQQIEKLCKQIKQGHDAEVTLVYYDNDNQVIQGEGRHYKISPKVLKEYSKRKRSVSESEAKHLAQISKSIHQVSLLMLSDDLKNRLIKAILSGIRVMW